mmetsp:Transcript_94232/g.170202  ORF Transcript_94232/g.170202 Transcript_94232/m.170202 type:complete len:515 (+) Transcript_94232:141-1685(+)
MARDWDRRDDRDGRRDGGRGDHRSDRNGAQPRRDSRDRGRDGRRDEGRGGRGYEQRDKRDDRRRQESRSRSQDPRRRGYSQRNAGGRHDTKKQRSRSRQGRSQDPRRRTGPRAHHFEKSESARRTKSSEYSSSSDSGSSSGSGKKKSGDSDKDEIVHFTWEKGILLQNRYKVVKLLGDGTFGRVLLAKDQETDREVAVKIIRDVKRYGENAKIEADILKDIRKADPQGTASRSAIMYETFWHGKHYCLVLEPCGTSLYDFLKTNDFRGFWMQDILTMAKQSLEALSFLHGRLQMTHTDLKPENILLESLEPARPSDFPRQEAWLEKKSKKDRSSSPYLRPATSSIRLIDFGNATYEDEHHSSIINTRQYRSPEVILAVGWNERSDVWSMGCIFMELYAGELLFGTHENCEHLALMERTLGRIPEKMLKATPASAKEKFVVVERSGQARLNWPEGAQSASSERHVRSQLPIMEMVPKEHSVFADFISQLLTNDPAKRPSAKEALRHRYLSEVFSD